MRKYYLMTYRETERDGTKPAKMSITARQCLKKTPLTQEISYPDSKSNWQ